VTSHFVGLTTTSTYISDSLAVGDTLKRYHELPPEVLSVEDDEEPSYSTDLERYGHRKRTARKVFTPPDVPRRVRKSKVQKTDQSPENQVATKNAYVPNECPDKFRGKNDYTDETFEQENVVGIDMSSSEDSSSEEEIEVTVAKKKPTSTKKKPTTTKKTVDIMADNESDQSEDNQSDRSENEGSGGSDNSSGDESDRSHGEVTRRSHEKTESVIVGADKVVEQPFSEPQVPAVKASKLKSRSKATATPKSTATSRSTASAPNGEFDALLTPEHRQMMPVPAAHRPSTSTPVSKSGKKVSLFDLSKIAVSETSNHQKIARSLEQVSSQQRGKSTLNVLKTITNPQGKGAGAKVVANGEGGKNLKVAQKEGNKAGWSGDLLSFNCAVLDGSSQLLEMDNSSQKASNKQEKKQSKLILV
jgi:hypothetical protein